MDPKHLDPLVEYQEKKLLAMAQKLVPRVTLDDLLQPNDYTILETHPAFRYEEGILQGIKSAQIVLQSMNNQCLKKS